MPIVPAAESSESSATAATEITNLLSTLAAGVNVIRDDERAFTLAVLTTKDTATTVGISDLFADGAVIFTELRLPVTVRGRRGHQAIGGSWSSATFTSLAQDGRINFPDIPIATKDGSWALFWSADQYLWQDPCDNERGLGLFAEAGITAVVPGIRGRIEF